MFLGKSWVLKIPFIKKKVEHSQGERLKNRFQKIPLGNDKSV